jgi:type I restriction enzyme S subunit
VRLRLYPEYQDGIGGWIERIPAHWRRSRLGDIATIKGRLGWKGLKAEEYVDQGYIFLSTPNIKGSQIELHHQRAL